MNPDRSASDAKKSDDHRGGLCDASTMMMKPTGNLRNSVTPDGKEGVCDASTMMMKPTGNLRNSVTPYGREGG